MWCSNVYKMASYTVVLLKELRGLEEKAFHCKGGGGEKFRLAKQMKFRSSARPDLRITPSPRPLSPPPRLGTVKREAVKGGGRAMCHQPMATGVGVEPAPCMEHTRVSRRLGHCT